MLRSVLVRVAKYAQCTLVHRDSRQHVALASPSKCSKQRENLLIGGWGGSWLRRNGRS